MWSRGEEAQQCAGYFRTGKCSLGRGGTAEAYLYRDQNGTKIEVRKKFSFIFPKEGWKYSQMESAGMAKPNIATANYDFDKETEVLIVDNGATTTLSISLC